MDGATILAPTPQGKQQLHAAATQLTPSQLSVLVRFDGRLTLDQVRAAAPAPSAGPVDAVAAELLRLGLLEEAQPDPFSLQWDADLRNLALAEGHAEADRGLAALQRTGFYVQIARSRPGSAAFEGGRAPEVVLVEDDQALAHFTRTFLALSGMRVRVAGQRSEVEEQIRRPPRPDLILLDVELPDADGFHILHRVREHPALRHVPVIMLTAKATRSDVIRGLALGADGYITKPFEPDTLLQAAGTVLGKDLRGASARAADPWAQRDAQADRRGLRPAGTPNA